jgi:HK97 family phage major capsid protein
MATATPTLLDELREQRKTKIDEFGSAIEEREAVRVAFEARIADEDETKRPSDEETAEYRAADDKFADESDERQAALKSLDRRIDEQKQIEKRRAQAAKKADPDRASVGEEPLTYRRDNANEFSYFRDLAAVSNPTFAASMRAGSPEQSRERLFHHAAEMEIEGPARAAKREARARDQVDEANGRPLVESPFERRVTPNRTDGQGGYFVPPAWWVDQYIGALRAGRVATGLARSMPLPEGTDSINIPKISTPTLTGVQNQDNAGLPSQDWTDTAVTANVKTLGGQSDVPIQLVEMSPGQIVDQVILEDLTADYNRLVDRQLLTGNGQNSAALNGGQIAGLYPAANWSGTNGVTYTQASPAASDFLSVFGAMTSQIAKNRFNLANVHFVLHPSRWFWFATGLDSNKRPLVDSPASGPWNAAALEDPSAPAEGFVGYLPFGPRVYIDGNVPTNDTTGGGTGQDVAFAAKWDDLWLFEGEPRFRVLSEVLSGTLELRYQVYNYVAFLARYGQSIALGTGSGFAAPAGAVSSIVF